MFCNRVIYIAKCTNPKGLAHSGTERKVFESKSKCHLYYSLMLAFLEGELNVFYKSVQTQNKNSPLLTKEFANNCYISTENTSATKLRCFAV